MPFDRLRDRSSLKYPRLISEIQALRTLAPLLRCSQKLLLLYMKSLFLLSFLLFTLAVQGQRPIKPIFCGNEIFSDIVRNHYPALAEDFNTTFEQAKAAISQRSDEP